MNKDSPLIRAMRACFLLVFLWGDLSALYVSSAQAQVPVVDVASNTAEASGVVLEGLAWANAYKTLVAIAAALGVFSGMLAAKLESLTGTIIKGTALEVGAQKAFTNIKGKMVDAVADSYTQDVFLKAQLRERVKNLPSQGCGPQTVLAVQQFPLTIRGFEADVSRMVVSAIENTYRREMDDGAGPQAASDNYLIRCGNKFASPVDHPEECVDTTTVGTDGRTLANADLDISTIMGGQVLVLPAFTEITVDEIQYKVPDPQTTEEKFWMAGMLYCFNLIGPRPSPPWGEKMDPPDARTARALWHSCTAKQSSLIKPCADLLAYHTRPSASQTELIAEHKTRCAAAESLGMTLPDNFEACEKGLSAYEIDYVTRSACKSPNFFVEMKNANGKDPALMDSSIECSASWAFWQEENAAKIGAVVASVEGIMKDLQNCWRRAARYMK